jgi:hypothetical protein
MDYIALNHNSERAKGVIYNSSKAIGGIYYKDERISPVKIEKNPTTGRKQAFVEIEKQFARKEKVFIKDNQSQINKIGEKYSENFDDDSIRKEELIAEKIEELKDERTRFEKRLLKQKQRAVTRLQRQLKRNHEKEIREVVRARQEELKELAKLEDETKKNYVITIQDQEIDFGKQDIKKADLNWQDKDWLAKAQNHFITTKQNGRRVGSAEEFTSMETLEALWSTAIHVGIDPKRFIVQIYNETRFNPNARGAAGERGIGQFKKATAQHHGYDWNIMTSGMSGYAYQAKAAAEFVQKVGEIAYNGGGKQARNYRDRINNRIHDISNSSASCVLKNAELCISKS